MGMDTDAPDMDAPDTSTLDTNTPDTNADADRLDGGMDTNPPDADSGDACVEREVRRPVDLLMVVDSSNSMREEQARLRDTVDGLVDGLSEGGVDALRFGVISPDLGIGGAELFTCSGAGDDAALSRSSTCTDVVVPPFIDFIDGSAAERASCRIAVGLDGCGFERQFDAMLRAVSPDSVSLFDGTGQRDAANAGFFRDDAVLVVVQLTDEDDCSPLSAAFYDGDDDLTRRCIARQGELQRIDTYVDGLLSVVDGDPDRLVMASIVGLPTDLVGGDYETMLDDTRMSFRASSGGGTWEPACEVVGPGGARGDPGRRFVRLAQGLEEEGVATLVESICALSYEAFFASLARAVAPLSQLTICE